MCPDVLVQPRGELNVPAPIGTYSAVHEAGSMYYVGPGAGGLYYVGPGGEGTYYVGHGLFFLCFFSIEQIT